LALNSIVGWLVVGAILTGATGIAEAAASNDGQNAYDLHNYDEAREIWEPLAKAGDAQAAFGLGVIYDLGNGVQQDQGAAFRWYRLAAEAGVPAAEFNVAVMADSGRGMPRDPALAALWYAKAAAHGHHRAQYDLAQLYENGDGVPRNYDQATAWYHAAAAGGLRAAADKDRFGKTGQALASVDFTESLTPPIPRAPAARKVIETAVEPTSVELVWNAPPQPAPATFFVEVLRVDRHPPHEIFAGYTDLSAVLTPATFEPGLYAWRVYAVGKATAHYSISEWQFFTIKR
jgi:Sel1 repeat